MQLITDKKIIASDYQQYLSDESRLKGTGLSRVYFPETISDVCQLVKEVLSRKETLCISGGRTGIVGGAVPLDIPNLVSVERLVAPFVIGFDQKEKKWYIRVSAGIRLCDMMDYLRAGDYHYVEDCPTAYAGQTPLVFPVNPTESTAQIGGIVSSNASGSRSFFYGPVRNWIRRVRFVSSKGTELDLYRGHVTAADGAYHIAPDLMVPAFDIPRPETKQTLAYAVSSSGDAIDLLIGSEGTLGIITDVDIYVIPAPAHVLGQILFFQDRQVLLKFIAVLKKETRLQTIAIEYYDRTAIGLLAESDEYHAYVPQKGTACALYIENIFSDERDMEKAYSFFESIFNQVGMSLDETWVADDAKGLKKMSELRHYIPETINRLIAERKKKCADICKVSSDMAVPATSIGHMLDYYEKELEREGLEYVIFGHIGDGNVHVNILPSTMDELAAARALYLLFARETLRCGGAIAAEHGIGRLKKSFLSEQFSVSTIQRLQEIKKIFDPHSLFNPGVIFDS
jgi:D-lactate dehydrogenase (cytochrome)